MTTKEDKMRKPYVVVDVTTNKVVARFASFDEATTKANERPKDWLLAHESHLNTTIMGVTE